jgi:hypothetical protein
MVDSVKLLQGNKTIDNPQYPVVSGNRDKQFLISHPDTEQVSHAALRELKNHHRSPSLP